MSRGNWHRRASVHRGLHCRGVCREGAAVQTRNMDQGPVRPQIVRQAVEVRRLVPQPVDQDDLQVVRHALSLRSRRPAGLAIPTAPAQSRAGLAVSQMLGVGECSNGPGAPIFVVPQMGDRAGRGREGHEPCRLHRDLEPSCDDKGLREAVRDDDVIMVSVRVGHDERFMHRRFSFSHAWPANWMVARPLGDARGARSDRQRPERICQYRPLPGVGWSEIGRA